MLPRNKTGMFASKITDTYSTACPAADQRSPRAQLSQCAAIPAKLLTLASRANAEAITA